MLQLSESLQSVETESDATDEGGWDEKLAQHVMASNLSSLEGNIDLWTGIWQTICK